MDECTRRALKILDDLVCEIPPGPFVIDEEYRELIALAQARPANQNGTDKSWVEHVVRDAREYWKSVKRADDS